jgi:outer membrane protein assembly factor BamB
MKPDIHNKSKTKKLPHLFRSGWFVLGISIFLIGIFTCVLVYLVYIKTNYPNHPIAYGNFPTLPEWIFYGDAQVISTPVINKSSVFVRTERSVYAINSSNGDALWHSESPGIESLSPAPQIALNVLIVPERRSGFAGFDLSTGYLQWRIPAIEINLNIPQTASIEDFTTDDRTFFVARFDWSLSAYRVEDGKLLWEVKVPPRANLYLAKGIDVIYLGADQFVRAYDQEDGRLVWEKNFSSVVGPLLFSEETLYMSIGYKDSSLIAYNVNSHDVLWQINLKQIGGTAVRAITIENDSIYLAAQQLIAISSVDGSIKWVSESFGFLETPVMSENNIYIRTIGPALYMLDKISGKENGRLVVQANTQMEHQPYRGPAVVGDLIIVPFGDHQVLAYRP